MARVILELIDDPVKANAVQLLVSHDPFPTHDEKTGEELPPTAAMMAAVYLIQQYKDRGSDIGAVVANDTTGPVVDALSKPARKGRLLKD